METKITNEELNDMVPAEKVTTYLNEFNETREFLINSAKQFAVEESLIEIIDRFLSLEDEIEKDGSIPLRMLDFHSRICAALHRAFTSEESVPKHVNSAIEFYFLAINFNKSAVVAYYQHLETEKKKLDAIKEDNDLKQDEARNSMASNFRDIVMAMAEATLSDIPGTIKTYAPGKKSLAASIKEVVAN